MNRNDYDWINKFTKIKKLIQAKPKLENFRKAHYELITIMYNYNISDEEIKDWLIQLGTDNEALTEFFYYHDTQSPVGPSAPPPLPEPSAPPPRPSAPPPSPPPQASAPPALTPQASAPPAQPLHNGTSAQPLHNGTSPPLYNALFAPPPYSEVPPPNYENNGVYRGGSKSPNKKRLSNKKKSKSRVIRRRPSLKRKKSRSGKGNKQTKKINKL